MKVIEFTADLLDELSKINKYDEVTSDGYNILITAKQTERFILKVRHAPTAKRQRKSNNV